MSSNIDFGFVDLFEQNFKSKCKYFPSKVGGKPAFLCLNPILNSENVTCQKCNTIMSFVLQIYAPIESSINAFHRTLFLFACNKGCNEFVIYRNQLPRVNKFYSNDPPDYESTTEKDLNYDPNPEHFSVKLCYICGIHGSKQCSQCKSVDYCSKDHQIIHWKSGHKETCQNALPSKSDFLSETLFPEYELLIDSFTSRDSLLNHDEDDNDEDEDDDDDDDDEEEIKENEMFKYKEYLAKNKPTMQNESVEEYDKEEEEDQKTFERFKKSAQKKAEIIRYRTDWNKSQDCKTDKDDILWISTKNMPPNLIPKCENCQSNRKFEFQVMPNLLNKICLDRPNRSDNVDFGTLLIYSCEKSCSSEVYLKEFIHNQSIG